MNLYYFNYYDLGLRAGLVRKDGTYMAVRHERGYSVVLYRMGEFFARSMVLS